MTEEAAVRREAVPMTVLIVDDEQAVRETCATVAAQSGMNPITVATAEDAFEVLEHSAVDILLTDLKLPRTTGVELLKFVRDLHPEVAVVVLTQYRTIDSAVEVTRLGAIDYVTKPFRIEELRSRLERVTRAVELQQENRLLREQLQTRPGFGGLIGLSQKMQRVYKMIEKVSQHEYPVLILGESGTGKELAARSIHYSGPRRDRPFAPVDCSSLVPTLIESELFGYVKGAFTGAMQSKQGLLEAAQGGTLFLDEIGDMPVDLQAKLLRALQEREVKPVGSTERRQINIRIIAATNRDLLDDVEAKVEVLAERTAANGGFHEPPATWPQASVSRIVAFPLEAEGQLFGALVTGLPGRATSLSTLDRLRLRARLAAFALQRKGHKEEETHRAAFEQGLLDLVPDPTLLLDHSGKIAAISRSAKELLTRAGLPGGSLSGYLSDHCYGHDRERIRKWIRQAIDSSDAAPPAGNETPRAELRNGIAVRLRLAPLVPGRAAVILDPEKAPEPKSQVSHSDAELQNVIEWLEEGVVLFDSQENVRVMNTRFEQIVGLAPDESRKIKTLEELIARLQGQAADAESFAERWRELARGGAGGVREQLNMVHPSPRVLDRSAKPVLDASGRQVGRVEIYRDLTAQRAFHSQLLQTEKLASLGQMVSGIAHELSNPLTSIVGYSQRLMLRRDELGRSEEMRQIYQEAERAGSILRQLLLNARETIPERRPVSLNDIVTRALELQRFSLTAENISVKLELDSALPLVHGDAGQLQQVVMNLMGNARHALAEQKRKGIIYLRTRKLAQRRALLEVEDNGPGVPQAIQSRIFDPFFTTKPAGVGTGLGLAIVLGVVREHGGQVRLQTPQQGGALFQIELPAATERQQEEAQAALPHEGKDASGEPATLSSHANSRPQPYEWAKNARVLVVEDEPTVAQLIADVLQDEGMRVDVLLDGREALDRAARESYDLVICDMKMPGLGGQRFYRSLQRNDNPLRERFLFVTGDVIAAHTREFLERNRVPHVAKPFRVEELTEKVHAVLRSQAEHSTAEASRKSAARNG